jgi:hypothetical protein
MKNIKTRGLAGVAGLSIVAGLLLASCGGGDPYGGEWTGTFGSNRGADAIVLGDGDYYMLYTVPGSSSFAGVIRGSGEFHGAEFTSTDAQDYNWEGRPSTKPASLTGKLSPRHSVAGSVNDTTPFKVSYLRDLDDNAQVSKLVGQFTGEATLGLPGRTRPAVFTVTSTGQVSTNVNNCPITGQLTPRSDVDAYDLTITLGAFPCFIPNLTFKGVVVYREDKKQIVAAVTNTPFKQAIAFAGTR